MGADPGGMSHLSQFFGIMSVEIPNVEKKGVYDFMPFS